MAEGKLSIVEPGGPANGQDYGGGDEDDTQTVNPQGSISPNQYTPQNSIPGAGKLPGNAGIIGQYLADKGGYAPHQIAGILGGMQIESGEGLDTNAVNPSSKAYGAPQWLDRKPNFEAWVAKNGGDKSNPVTQAQYILNELATTENSTDQALRNAKDEREAARAWRGFERNGTDNARVDESNASKLHNIMLAEAAKQPPPTTPPPPSADLRSKWADALKQEVPPQDQQQVPILPTSASKTAKWAKALQDEQNHPATAYAVPPSDGVFSELGNAARWIPSVMARGATDFIDEGVVSPINALSRWMSTHPLAPGNLQEAMANNFGPTDSDVSPVANPQNPITPRPVGRLAGAIGINTQQPSDVGDTSWGARTVENLGYVAGATLPGQVFRIGHYADAAEKAVTLAGKVTAPMAAMLHDQFMPLWTWGLGREMGGEIGYQEGGKEGQESGRAIGGAIGAAKTLITAGTLSALKNTNSWFRTHIAEIMNPAERMKAMADDPAQALANLEAGGKSVPSGFHEPVSSLTMDEGLLAFEQQIAHTDRTFNGQWRLGRRNNEAAVQEAMNPVAQGTAGDAYAAVQDAQKRRVAATEERISQAVEDAERAFEAAVKGAGPGGVDPKAASAYFKGALIEARNDRHALTQYDMQVAREASAGYKTNTTRVFDDIHNLMSERVKNLIPEKDFPYDVLKDWYHKDPRGLFEKGTGVPINPPAESVAVPKTVDTEQIFNMRKAVDDAFMRESRYGGNDTKAGYLARIRDSLDNALLSSRNPNGTFRFGAKEDTIPAALKNAINSAQEENEIFNKGVVGRVLGVNKDGLPLVDPGSEIKFMLGNSSSNTSQVKQMFDAVAAKQAMENNGMLVQHPADTMRDALVAHLRQDFYNAAAQGPKSANQWRTNMDRVLNGPGAQFDHLRQEIDTALNQRDLASQVHVQGGQELTDLRNSQAGLFLRADPGKELDKALRSRDQYGATKDLIGDVMRDPTGRAMEGFANMASARMFQAATNPSGTFNALAGQRYLRDNAQHIKAIDDVYPGFQDRLERVSNALAVLQRGSVRPDTVPMSVAERSLMVTGLGKLGARILGAMAGHRLSHFLEMGGNIQIPGMGSALGASAFDRFVKDLPLAKGQEILQDAFRDKDLMAALLRPQTSPQAAVQLQHVMEPYLLLTPEMLSSSFDQQDAKPVTADLQRNRQLGLPPVGTPSKGTVGGK